jgi:hypothetical protein
MDNEKAQRIIGFALEAGIKNPKIEETFQSNVGWKEVFCRPGGVVISGSGKEPNVEDFKGKFADPAELTDIEFDFSTGLGPGDDCPTLELFDLEGVA